VFLILTYNINHLNMWVIIIYVIKYILTVWICWFTTQVPKQFAVFMSN